MNVPHLLSSLSALDVHIVTLGDTDLTLFSLIKLIALIAALFYLSGRLHRLLVRRMLEHTPLDPSAREVVGSVARYLVLLIGFLIIVQTSGVNLTSLNVIAGAIGVGVGFGLQNVVSNFISGLIIMFEHPIKIGDRIALGGVEGEVTEIGPRRSTVVTDDNVTFIVPNSRFITENVVNLHYSELRVRVRAQVTVARGPDPRLVRSLLLEAAKENPHVLDQPPAEVRLLAFKDNGAAVFELLAWNVDRVHAREALISELYFQINDKFTQNNIKVA
jgi:small-conductance mechanosensitive channel